MKNMLIDERNLDIFLKNIRPEDKEELEYIFGEKYKKIFSDFCLKSDDEMCFIEDGSHNPLFIGGVCEEKSQPVRIGRIWLLSTIYFKKYKFSALKFVREKIREYKLKYDFLYNDIYRTNFSILKILKHEGFVSINTNNKDLKLFYFKKGDFNFDIQCNTCK